MTDSEKVSLTGTTGVKIFKDFRTLEQILAKQKQDGKKIVFTNGCFALLHAGHIYLFGEAKKRGDILVVALNSDRSVAGLKGDGRMLLNEDERCIVIAALEMVDYVTVFDDPTPQQIIDVLKPDVLIKGGDYKIDQIVGRETVWQGGGVVEAIPIVRDVSTTSVINRIVERHRA